MKHEPFVETTTVKQITELLQAHAVLIGETSEQLAQNVIVNVEELHGLMTSDVAPDIEHKSKLLREILKAIQLQDILRQQVQVVFSGLAELSTAQVPAVTDPAKWVEEKFKKIEANYVMRSQSELHANVLGLKAVADDPVDDLLF